MAPETPFFAVPGGKDSISEKVGWWRLFLTILATGDCNPIHWNQRFARQSGFEGIIAHGVITLGMISGILGRGLSGTLIRSISGDFLRPVYPADILRLDLVVVQMKKNVARLRVDGRNQKDDIVFVGEVTIVIPRKFQDP